MNETNIFDFDELLWQWDIEGYMPSEEELLQILLDDGISYETAKIIVKL